MMTNENPITANQLHVARRRLANGHDPVLRLVALVDVEQGRMTFVNGEELVLNGRLCHNKLKVIFQKAG
jgi:hypothetical protein